MSLLESLQGLESSKQIVLALTAHVASLMAENANVPTVLVESYCKSLREDVDQELGKALSDLKERFTLEGTHQDKEVQNLFILYVCGHCLEKITGEPWSIVAAERLLRIEAGGPCDCPECRKKH